MHVSSRKFIAKITILILFALTAGLLAAFPVNIALYAQCVLITLFQIPLHEFAHYLVARKFYYENIAGEIGPLQGSLSKTETEFVKAYLAPRFGWNAFYGIKSLRIVPTIFTQELNYTGKQFALITLAGPLVDIALAALYIFLGLKLGPIILLGFFSTEIMMYFGVMTILSWSVAYMIRKLDLGQFRYSNMKRNASNRFLMSRWYLTEAMLDEQGQFILDHQSGKMTGKSRLRYLFEKLKTKTLSKTELDLLIEAVIAANPPLAKVARIGTWMQHIYEGRKISESQMAQLETEVGKLEKALKVHTIACQMDQPLYFGLDLAGAGYDVNRSSRNIQGLLHRMKKLIGTTHEIPYMIAGGKLISFIEKAWIKDGGAAALQTSREFGTFINVREVKNERQAFKGRRTVQVGIAVMQAPEGGDFSRELAHAEVLWAMISGRKKGISEAHVSL